MARFLGDNEEKGALLLGEHTLGSTRTPSSPSSGVGGGSGVMSRRSGSLTGGGAVSAQQVAPRRRGTPTRPRLLE